MSKVRVLFACQACGLESSKWLGRCPDCGEWNSFVEERREDAPAARGRPAILAEGAQSRPKPYDLIAVAEAAAPITARHNRRSTSDSSRWRAPATAWCG